MVLWTYIAKTRGVGSQGRDWTRSTTSVCRRDQDIVKERIGVDAHIDSDNQQGLRDDEQVEHGEGFPGGPSDMSLLVNFVDHVIVKLWEDEVRTEKPSIKLSLFIIV